MAGDSRQVKSSCRRLAVRFVVHRCGHRQGANVTDGCTMLIAHAEMRDSEPGPRSEGRVEVG